MTDARVDDHWTEERLWWLQARMEALYELYGLDAPPARGVPDGPDTIRETQALIAAYRTLRDRLAMANTHMFHQTTTISGLSMRHDADQDRIAALAAAGDRLATVGGHAHFCAIAARPLTAVCDCGWDDVTDNWEQAKAVIGQMEGLLPKRPSTNTEAQCDM